MKNGFFKIKFKKKKKNNVYKHMNIFEFYNISKFLHKTNAAFKTKVNATFHVFSTVGQSLPFEMSKNFNVPNATKSSEILRA